MISGLNRLETMYPLLCHPHAAREEIVAFQNRQLRHLITHAYNNVPYYRMLFDQNGIKPKDIQSVSDLPAIPISSKKDIQSLPMEEVVARGVNPKNLFARRTSGSSGEPLTIRRTWFEQQLFGLFRLRMMRDFGLRFTDRQVSIGLIRERHQFDDQLPLKIIQALGLLGKVRINCLLPPEDIVRLLRDLCPSILTGFSGVLLQISHIIGVEDRLSIRPRFMVAGAEVLTPLMRHQITEAFKAPVFEVYASLEFSMIAWECKKTGELHTCDDNLIVEVLDDDRPVAIGERGEVVGTNLHSFAMPFIRYRLGDIVTKGSETCQCGQPFSTIRAIQGRMLDYFPLPGGRMIHPYEITVPHVGAASWVRQYQLIQEREDRIILRVVPLTTPTTQELARLQESVTTILGQGVEFQVILVPEIQLEPSGKFRVSRSLVKSAYDGIDWEKQQTDRLNSSSRYGNDPL